MQNKSIKILVLFVEPMLYGMDLIHEVYERTQYEFKYIYCYQGLTGKDGLELPENSYLNSGNNKERRRNVLREIKAFEPDFVVVNGYVGLEQTVTIRYCQKHKIPYAIESDTPLHVPENRIKAYLKRKYLSKMLNNEYCYGFPGGTLQKENLVYYGIPEEKCFVMPMSVSEKRLLDASDALPDKRELRKEFGIADKKVFLFVGRLESVKNVKLLVQAFEDLKRKQEKIALIIVGDGTQADDLKEYVAKNDVQDVFFAGYILFPEIVRFYKMADVFILPSMYEPWGLVVNEAQIMGLCTILSSSVGCAKDLLIDGNNGFVFESGNRSSLVEKMEAILDEQSKSFSNNARKVMDKWNYDYYLKCFEGAIENVVKD